MRDRGLGDTLKRITKAVGITPCGGCVRRAELLNRLAPYAQKGKGMTAAELLAEIKQEIAGLEADVTAAQERAGRLAEPYAVSCSKAIEAARQDPSPATLAGLVALRGRRA